MEAGPRRNAQESPDAVAGSGSARHPAPMTVRSALRAASRRIAARDGSVLLGSVLGVGREALYLAPDRPLSGTECLQFERLVRRRRRGEPVAYLTGRVRFFTVDLEVSDAVLIPRPETEGLVEAVVADVLARGSSRLNAPRQGKADPVEVADIGTGSGAIAVSVAHELGACVRVHATDRSATALAVARRNVARLGLGGQVMVHRPGELTTPLVEDGTRVDVLVMNPPYVRRRDLGRLSREVMREPRLALDGGPDGLQVVRRLVRSIPVSGVLRTGGSLWLEMGAGQALAVRHLLEETGFRDIRILPDLAGIERVVGARWPGSKS